MSAVPLAHFDTFARLRYADAADANVLAAFARSIRTRKRLDHAAWRRLLLSEDSVVVLASECDILVGAAILRHPTGAKGARLAWIGVAPDARRRGVGRLLLVTVTEEAQAAGAVELRALVPDEAGPAEHLLQSVGFLREGTLPDWRLALWHRRRPVLAKGGALP